MSDTLLPNTYPQSQKALRKTHTKPPTKTVSSGLWGACLASRLLCELGWMLHLSGLWDLNLVQPVSSKACSVSVRYQAAVFRVCVCGVGVAETQPKVHVSDPGRGCIRPEEWGPFSQFLQDAVWPRGGPIRTERVGGTLQSLGGTLHFPLTS